jgi:hypothetical protein
VFGDKVLYAMCPAFVHKAKLIILMDLRTVMNYELFSFVILNEVKNLIPFSKYTSALLRMTAFTVD